MEGRSTGADPKLIKLAKRFEKRSYFPRGVELDGCPYTANPSFLDILYAALDEPTLMEEVVRLGGDPNCANWQAMAGLSLLGIKIRFS